MTALIIRRIIQCLTVPLAPKTTPILLNPPSILHFSFPPPPPTNSVTSGAAADVTDLSEPEEETTNETLLPIGVAPASEAITLPTLLQPRVVVYDGVCHLCHQGVKWVIEADKERKIKFCCLQSKAAEPYLKLCGLEREDVLKRFLFVEGPGYHHQASTAALRVLAYLPLPYSALSALLIVPNPLRDAVYDYVAKHRYNWFGKADKCLVLNDIELLERFIDRDEMMGRN